MKRLTSHPWLRWLPLVGVALIGIILGRLSLGINWPGAESTPEAVEASAPDTVAANDEAARREALLERQRQVSLVISELDRSVLIGDSPTLGNPDAEMVILEFSDFQCGFCARAVGAVKPFLAERSDEVLFVYKHLPLVNIHPQAIPAAQAAWAAQQQGAFWPFHDALFERQDQLGEDLYRQIAQELGLDLERFDRDRASEASQAAIARDLALAAELGLNSTPTFLFNDLMVPGAVPTEFFHQVLDQFQEFQSRSGQG